MASPPETALEDWLAAEAAQRQRIQAGPGPGVASHADVAAQSGLQLLQAMLRGEQPHAAIAQTLDFMLVEVAHGHAVFQGRPVPAHLNPMGSVHGGWFAALLDSAMGCCVHASLPQGKGYTTLELKMNLIRAITPKVERVRAVGKLIHLGGQTAISEAQLLGPDGKLYAHATCTCLVFDLRSPEPAGAG